MSTVLLPGIDHPGVLISIRPSFASMIVAGTKTIELRRRFPELPMGTIVVLYVTQPVGAAVGYALLRSTTPAAVRTLWRRFGPDTGITRTSFDAYFRGSARGVALELASYCPFKSALHVDQLKQLWPGFAPPQSFRYVSSAVLGRLTESGAGGLGDPLDSSRTPPRISAMRVAGPRRPSSFRSTRG